MNLADYMVTDLAAIMTVTEFGQSVSYAGQTIVAIVGHASMMSESVGAVTRERCIWVQAADVPAPAYRDAVTIDGDTWYVGPEDRHERQGAAWKLPLYRDERPVI